MYDLSDHLPIFFSTNLEIHKDIKENDDTEIRDITDMNDNNVQLFKQKLGAVHWSSVCPSDDAKKSYAKFMEKFQEFMMNVSQKSVLRNAKVETSQGRLEYLSLY